MVIKINPIPDDTTCVLQGLESMTMNALVLEGSDAPLDHAVLLRGVRGDELLLQPVAFDHGRVASAGEDLGPATAADVPSEQFSRMAIDHQGQRGPVVPATPNSAHVRGPHLVDRSRHAQRLAGLARTKRLRGLIRRLSSRHL